MLNRMLRTKKGAYRQSSAKLADRAGEDIGQGLYASDISSLGCGMEATACVPEQDRRNPEFVEDGAISPTRYAS